MNFTKNGFLWIFVVIAIIILIVLTVCSAIIYFEIVSMSSDIQSKFDILDNITTKLNNNLQSLNQLDDKLSNIEKEVSHINSNTKSLPLDVQSIGSQLSNISSELNSTRQNLIINNISQNELNSVIENTIDVKFNSISTKTNVNLIFNIVFGALLSLGGIGGAIYFIVNREKKTKKQDKKI